MLARSMHKIWIGIGLLILIAGLVLGILGNVQNNVGTLSASDRTGVYTASDQLLGTGALSVAWSQAPANATFAFNVCASSGCASVRTLATGNGSSGSFSTDATNGQSFQIALTHVLLGSNVSATIAWTESGFTYVALGGIALSIGGVALMVVAIRRS